MLNCLLLLLVKTLRTRKGFILFFRSLAYNYVKELCLPYARFTSLLALPLVASSSYAIFSAFCLADCSSSTSPPKSSPISSLISPLQEDLEEDDAEELEELDELFLPI